MDRKKQKRLEKAGWRVGSASEFLGLSAAEVELVAMKLSLSAKLKKARERRQITQTDLAERMGSSQSRVAKMEGQASNPKRRRGLGIVTANACTECRKKRSKVRLDMLIVWQS